MNRYTFRRPAMSPQSVRNAVGFIIIFLLFLAQSRIWPSVIGRVGANTGGAIFVLTFPLLALASLALKDSTQLVKFSDLVVPRLTILFGVWTGITTLWAANLGLSFDAWVVSASVMVLAVIAGNWLPVRIIQLGIIVAALFGLVLSFLTCVLAPQVGFQDPSAGYTAGISGIYLHKNYFGFVMGIATLSVSTLVGARPIVKATLAAVFIFAVAMSSSATAQVATGVGLVLIALVYVLKSQFARRHTFVKYVSSGAILLSVLTGFVFYRDVLNILSRYPDLTGRTSIWNASFNWFLSSPVGGFGWGIPNVWGESGEIRQSVSQSLGFSVSHAHNSFLEVALESGLVALLLILTMIVLTFWRAIKLIITSRVKQEVDTLIWVLAIVSFVIIDGFFEATLIQERGLFLIVVCTVIVECRRRNEMKK